MSNLSTFNAKNVTQFSCMFNNCYNLTKITFPRVKFCMNSNWFPWIKVWQIKIFLHSSSPAWAGAQFQFPYLLCIISIILQARLLENVLAGTGGREQTW